jgi:hypothetical protein
MITQQFVRPEIVRQPNVLALQEEFCTIILLEMSFQAYLANRAPEDELLALGNRILMAKSRLAEHTFIHFFRGIRPNRLAFRGFLSPPSCGMTPEIEPDNHYTRMIAHYWSHVN